MKFRTPSRLAVRHLMSLVRAASSPLRKGFVIGVAGCLLIVGVALAVPPVNSNPPTLPTIAGTAQEGQTLTLTQAGWDGTQTSVTDQWQRCDTGGGSCSDISGQTGSSYQLGSADVGHTIEVLETASNADGPTPISSQPTATVAPLSPPTGGHPSLGGTAQQGQTLTLSQGAWTNSPTLTDQWEQCDTSGANCTSIGGQTGSSYVVAAGDVGHTIEVVETATNDGGTATATAGPTATVTALAPTVNNAPTLAGTAQQGQTLTLTQGTWNNTPTSVTNQWEQCSTTGTACTAIAGQTGTTYVIAVADVGHTIEVLETASNTGGTATATAGPTATVTALAPTVITAPTIAGTAQEGQTLTLTQGTWNNTPTSVTDQWERCDTSGANCAAIAGQTGLTYVVGAADAAHTLEVLETATNTGGTATSPSSHTATIVAPPTPITAPLLSGNAIQNQTLTDHHGNWTGSPTSYTYTWTRCDSNGLSCVAIAGATGQTYTLTEADVGGTIYVTEVGANAGGNGPGDSSALTAVVTTPSLTVPVPVNTALPTVGGTPQQGATLIASNGAWEFNPNAYQYQWFRCRAGSCTAVPGATAQTYTLGPGDVGYALEAQESAVNTGGTGGPVTSGATSVVTATSSTALVAPQTSVTNQQVLLIATVTSSSGNASVSGSVSFRTASGPITGCGAVSAKASGQSATVTCPTSFATGTTQATAVFSAAGGSLLGGSSSQASTIAVGRAPTSTHLTAPGQAARRSNIKYTASVAPRSTPARPVQVSGTVTFMDRGKTIRGCSGRRLVKSSASCQVRYTGLGAHRITARYSGNADFGASTSAVGKVAIGRLSPNYVTSVMQWYVHYSPTHTNFTSWLAYGVPTGSSFYFTCHGQGCPFATHTLAVANSARCTTKGKSKCPTSRTINLEPVFGSARLAVGTTVTVSILRCGWYGKHYTLKIRSRHAPSSAIATLPIGVTRPGIRC